MADRVLVIGLGSIGLRHVSALSGLGVEVAVLRRSKELALAAEAALGVRAFGDRAAAAQWQPGAAVVATPTSEHVADMRWALGQGCDVLVEKPLSHALDGVEELLGHAEQERRIVAVGCNLRFHPALVATRAAVRDGRLGRLLSVRAEVGQYLPDWHPGEDHLAGYAARVDQGGGAALTLIHELDYVLWIAGPARAVAGVRATASPLGLDVDDVAELLVEHEQGAISSVHMDLFDRAYHRRSRWIGSEASIEWRWGGPVVLERGAAAAEVLWDDPHFDLGATYRAQMADFLAARAGGSRPRTTGREGLAALALVLSVIPRPRAPGAP